MLIQDNLQDISDDSLIKLVRQLDFWCTENGMTDENELLTLTQRLINTATWKRHSPHFKVPKVRFGKTEVQMPIVTCGGMRFQHTWMPDYLPISASKSTVVQSPSQNNMVNVVRQCLQVGINHFETARMYGSSEVQLMEALVELMENGEIQRSDFILQTKLPTVATRKEFMTHWERSWKIFHKLGYIDLLSFWVVSTNDQVEWVLREGDDSIMAAALEWQKQGYIKHIGFSTHGTASNIMKLVNSEKFSYINVHYHYFGSYHAEGTMDGSSHERHGNEAIVKRALELDMGVFNISPIDKGGMLYAPSKQVVRTIGPNLSPIGFALLKLWSSSMHTASVGFARLSDLDEVLEAARIHAAGDFSELHAAEERLNALKILKLGKEWTEKGLLNLPDCYDESTELTSLGHVLWLHNVISAFGMYKFAKARYSMLEKCVWNKNKSFQENASKMSAGNIGRSVVPGKDYSQALSNHYDPKLAAKKLQECHEWLKKDTVFTDEELQARGWDTAYDLTTWHEFPDTNRISISGIILQNLSGGFLGIGGGPSDEVTAHAMELRRAILQGC